MAKTDGFRIENDTLGDVRVPAKALWGAQTQRAVENFPVSGRRLPRRLIRALGLVKKAAAEVNRESQSLPSPIAEAIATAAQEVAHGQHDEQFPVDVFQTGSGTSSHMNANEVIANRAIELLGGERGTRSPVHPNDHVNRGQSSNDVFPSAVHLAAAEALEQDLLPALRELEASLREKARSFDDVIKIGRTHLQDAVPIRLGQEMAGYATMVGNGQRRLEAARPAVCELALGGTAVGTGLGAAPGFAPAVITRLVQATGLPLRQAPDLREALATRDGLVELSAALRGAAVSLTKIANDLRWLASGPRCGLGELRLPELQPGSSIMPGKVNPVMPEMLLMVCAEVMGNDTAVAWAGASGNFELNAMIPLIAWNVLTSLDLLARAVRLFTARCVSGLEADAERCAALVEQSLALATALVPRLGYDASAALAREALATGKTIRQLCREKQLIPEIELDRLLDPRRMTEPANQGLAETDAKDVVGTRA
jgi:fumarate hydratase class II